MLQIISFSGFKEGQVSTCINIVKALEKCDDEIKAINLGALLLICKYEKPLVEKILNAASDKYMVLEPQNDEERAKGKAASNIA